MHFLTSQALLGLLATLIPSALGTPIDGTNITSTTSPSLVDRSELAWSPSPSNLGCYALMKGCKHKDVHLEAARKTGEEICNTPSFKKAIAKPGWQPIAGWSRNPYWVSYNIKVEWKEGCTAPGDGTMSVANPAPGVDCFDVVWTTWKNCNGNGGRGGKVDFGCLTYHYNPINGKEAGDGYCVNIPFDNYTYPGY